MTESNGSGRLSVCATSLRGQRRQNYGNRRVWCQLREGGTKGILSQHHTAKPGKRPMCGSVATDRDGTGLGQPGPTPGAGQSPGARLQHGRLWPGLSVWSFSSHCPAKPRAERKPKAPGPGPKSGLGAGWPTVSLKLCFLPFVPLFLLLPQLSCPPPPTSFPHA